MAEAAKAHLTQALNSHVLSIQETFQMLDQSVVGSLQKVDWAEVTKLGEEVSKQATVAGMLWTGNTAGVKELEENIKVYCNCLQGFLLLCHGSVVGAGPTLSACVHESAKRVTDSSLSLLTNAASFYGSKKDDKKLSIPQFVGSVWEACTALKKTPTSNCTAIGRAMTKVAVSIKDVLREMNDLRPKPVEMSNDQANGSVNNLTVVAPEPHEDDGSSEDDIGNDLSPEEMMIAQLAVSVISATLAVIKELIRFVTSLLKILSDTTSGGFVDSLETLLEICQSIGHQVDELGACVYPPQETPLMKTTADALATDVEKMKAEVLKLEASAESLFQACETLEVSVTELVSKLEHLNDGVEDKLQTSVCAWVLWAVGYSDFDPRANMNKVGMEVCDTALRT